MDVDFHIHPGTKLEAAEAHETLRRTLQNDPSQILCYTDGSRLDSGAIGAGIARYQQGRTTVVTRLPMGSQAEVYDAELLGATTAISQCLDEALHQRVPPTDVWVFLDNTSAIRRLQHLANGPGQDHAITTYDNTEQLKALGVKVHIHWVPGHTDVDGNEAADQLAKEAAAMQARGFPTTTLTWLRRQVKATIMKEWIQDWDSGKRTHGRDYEGYPSLRLCDIYRHQPRATTSQLIHLRTGHGYFRSYLERIPAANIDSAECRCSAPRQDAKHLLLRCPQFRREREILRTQWGNLPWTKAYLLHSKKGPETAGEFLKTTRVGMRGWFKQVEGEDERGDREEERWRSSRAGWGRLLDEEREEAEEEE